MERWTRRRFFLTSLAGSAAASVGRLFGKTLPGAAPLPSGAAAAQSARPLTISSANGVHALDKGMEVLKRAATHWMR